MSKVGINMHFGQRANQTEKGQSGLHRATAPGQGTARLQAQAFLVQEPHVLCSFMLTANINPGNRRAKNMLRGNSPIEKPAECD